MEVEPALNSVTPKRSMMLAKRPQLANSGEPSVTMLVVAVVSEALIRYDWPVIQPGSATT